MSQYLKPFEFETEKIPADGIPYDAEAEHQISLFNSGSFLDELQIFRSKLYRTIKDIIP